MASVDEAYLDLAGTERIHGPPFAAAHALLREITANDRAAVFGGLRANAAGRKSGERSGQAARLALGYPPGRRQHFSRRSACAASRELAKSPKRALKAPGIETVEQLAAATQEKLEQNVRPVGHGAVPQSARRRHLRIFRGCRAEIDLAQPHLFVRYSEPCRARRRSACSPRNA